jgi:hypothetical protein
MHHFNNRANGIFADGFTDRDGRPVADTFVYQLRAKLIGTLGRNWTKDMNAKLSSRFSSDELAAIMSPDDAPHIRVEYDKNFYGGNYNQVGAFAFVPEQLVDVLAGDVEAAFEMMFSVDRVHVVSITGDERFDADGAAVELGEPANQPA